MKKHLSNAAATVVMTGAVLFLIRQIYPAIDITPQLTAAIAVGCGTLVLTVGWLRGQIGG
jgi:hypothetical protein